MPAFDPDRLARAFDVAAGLVRSGTVPYAIAGVAGAAGTVRLDAVSGAAGPRTGTRAVCLLASISKPITATVALRLAEDGRLPLAAPLSTWLPELAGGPAAGITAWHVLTHTTGMGDVDVEALVRAGAPRAEHLRRAIAGPVETAPGSSFRYVTATFDLLAEAIARVAGRPFPEVLRAELLEPLGMTSTTFDPRAAFADRMAPVEIGPWDGPPGSPPADEATRRRVVDAFIALELAGGGLWSTADDLLRLGRMLLRGGELDGVRILGRPFVELATRRVTGERLGRAGDPLLDEHYALGWGKASVASPASPAAFGHGGVAGTRLWIDPEHDLVVVLLGGRWGLPSIEIDRFVHAVYAALR